ncbi:MAG: heparinase II/III family protein [Prevotella sp.]|nr:heparinase II/III family protein [Prevotella sp.]
MRQSYIAFGEKYLGKAWQSLPASAFAEFKKTGNRTHYESLMFEKRRQLAALVMAELAEGERRFTADIVNGLLSTLEETWWGLPAHYRTELPRTEDQTVDLFNAETAALVAYTRRVMATELDRFSPLLCKRIDSEIGRRILQPAVKTNYWWKKASMNWNPWICSNWLACVLFCEHDEARRTEALSQIAAACRAFIEAYPADGGCDEGTHYWDRAAASLFETLYLLNSSTALKDTANQSEDGRLKVVSLNDEKLRAMEAYIYKMYIGNDYVVNVADAHGNKALLNINIAYPFGLATGDKTMRQYAAHVARSKDLLHQAATLYNASGNWPSLPRELIMLSCIQQLLREKPQEPTADNVWLPDLQIMTARTQSLFAAFKGGNNGESHNHNDVGSLIVYADGEPLLIDPGVGEYTAKTFSKQRYEIWTMQSAYHNLPIINGQQQRDGKQYAARMVSHKPRQLTLDIAGAYPEEAAVRSWLRTVSAKGKKGITVTEDFQLTSTSAPSQLVFITTQQPDVSQAGAVLLGSHRLSYNARQLEPQVEDISHLLDPVLQQMWGGKMYRLLLTVRQPAQKQLITYSIQ